MTTSHHLTSPHSRLAGASARGATVTGLCVVGAVLMVVSGAIHLHLWDQYYRHITTGHINVLFMVQLILAFVGAAALLVLRNRLATVAGALLMAGTAVGYLIARYHSGGLFGFYLGPTFSSSDATWSLIVEIAGAVLLAATTVVLSLGERSTP
jgi:hypothetical protein